MGFGVFLGTFCTSKKYPGAWGHVAPVKPRCGAGEAPNYPRPPGDRHISPLGPGRPRIAPLCYFRFPRLLLL